MAITTAVAKASPQLATAAQRVREVQDAVNLRALLRIFHETSLTLGELGLSGDEINNHPIMLCYLSKLNSLCRFDLRRELAAFEAVDKLARLADAEYEVIPL